MAQSFSPVAIAVTFEADFGAGFVDISADVRFPPHPTWSWGITGEQPANLVAAPGRFRFALDNSTKNSGGLEGYYSPDHTNLRSGFAIGMPVRIKVVASGSTSYKKYYLRSITPQAGAAGERKVLCLATDWMDEAARQILADATVQVNQDSDALFTTITNLVSNAPDNTSSDTGTFNYPFALDEIDTHRDVALTAYQLLAQSGWDRIYLKRDGTDGETLVFENHSHRLTTATNDATFDDDTIRLVAQHDERRIINAVDCASPVRTVDPAGATTVLATIGDDRPVVGAGETVTILLPYRDPDNEAQRVAAVAADMIAPVETTDYLMQSGGVDVSSDHTVTATFFTSEVKFEVENTGLVNSTITKLQARGRGLYSYGEKHVVLSDATSQTTYGERQVAFTIPWQTDVNVCHAMDEWLLEERKDPRTDVRSMTYVANRHDTLAQASHDVDVGSRIALDESVTGVSASSGTGMWVNHIQMMLDQTVLRVTYQLEHAIADQSYFILNSSTLGPAGTDVLAAF